MPNTRPRVVGSTATQQQEQIDPMQLVRELLAPAPSPTVQKLSTMDKIGTVLNSIAQGVSIGTSADPGRALQGQLQQQQQMKFQEQQAQKEREDRIAMLNRQFANQIIGGQLDEQRQVRSEDRAEKRYERQKKDSMDDFIKREGIQFDFQTKRDAKQNEYQKANAILQHTWDKEKQDKMDDRFDRQQTRLENKDLFDAKMKFFVQGIPYGMAKSIAEKETNGQELTEAEQKQISAAAKRQIAMANRAARSGGSGGGSGGMITDKMKNQYLAARMKDNFVVVAAPDGSEMTIEMTNAPKDEMGQIIGMKRVATDEDKMIKLSSEIGMMDILSGKQQIGQATAKVPEPAQLSAVWDQRVKNDLAKGLTKEQIANKLQQYLQIQGANMSEAEVEAINNAFANNKLQEKKTGKVDSILQTGSAAVQKKIDSKPGTFGRRF